MIAFAFTLFRNLSPFLIYTDDWVFFWCFYLNLHILTFVHDLLKQI